MLLQMQKAYKGDDRFKLDNRFAGDINLAKNKLTSTVIGSMSKLEANQMLQKKKQDDELIFDKRLEELDVKPKKKKADENEVNIEQEKNKAFTLLSQIVPAAEVFFKPSGAGDKRKKNITIKRFDPKRLKQCGHLLKPTEEEEEKSKATDNSKIKIMNPLEWSKRQRELADKEEFVSETPMPNTTGKKVVQISSDWLKISKHKEDNETPEEQPSKADADMDDDFVLEFSDDDNDASKPSQFTLGKVVTDKIMEESKQKIAEPKEGT